MGCDVDGRKVDAEFITISIRAPVWGAIYSYTPYENAPIISIRAPVWGAIDFAMLLDVF